MKHNKNSNRFSTLMGFLDTVFNILMQFVLVFTLLWLITRVEQEQKKPAPEELSEIVITMTWPAGNDDVDMWVMDPAGNKTGWFNKDSGAIHLQRDDLGDINDRIVGADGTVTTSQLNIEVINIRYSIPGNYVVNAHMFRKSTTTPIKVTTKLVKVNPYREYPTTEVILESNGQEETALNIEIDDKKNIVSVKQLPLKFVQRAGAGSGAGPFGGW